MNPAQPFTPEADAAAFAEWIAHRQEPEALLTQRRADFARAIALGWPTRQQEAWRFTEMTGLLPCHFQCPAPISVDPTLFPTLGLSEYRMVLVNGALIPEWSTIPAPLQTIAPADISTFSGLEKHPFVARTLAYSENGLFLQWPHNTALVEPIHIVVHATGNDMVLYPRIVLALEAGAQATVVLEYQGTGHYAQMPLVDIQLGQGAVLEYHSLQNESAMAQHFGALRIQQAPHSRATIHTMSSGAKAARTDIAVYLAEDAHCSLNGLTVARDQQFSATHVQIDHAKPRAESVQSFKSVLQEKARTVFDGLIHVQPQAQKTSARQNSRNLLLSRQAQAHNNPRLEILADDVQCSHGTSTGILDADAEFYLRARGITATEARTLLVQAFAQDSIDTITVLPIRERLRQQLATALALE